MGTTITETPHVWQGQPPYWHVTCSECLRTMSYRREESAQAWALKHQWDHDAAARRCDRDDCDHAVFYYDAEAVRRCAAGHDNTDDGLPHVRLYRDPVGDYCRAALQREFDR